MEENGKGKMKTIHVNNDKQYRQREGFVGSVCMLAEEQDTIPDEPVLGSEMCAGLCFIRCLLSLKRTYLVGR